MSGLPGGSEETTRNCYLAAESLSDREGNLVCLPVELHSAHSCQNRCELAHVDLGVHGVVVAHSRGVLDQQLALSGLC